MSLRVCEGCDRHTHGQASACPYCGTAMSKVEGGPALSALGRMGRAALALGGVTAFSAAMVACYGGPTPPRAPADARDPDESAQKVDAGVP